MLKLEQLRQEKTEREAQLSQAEALLQEQEAACRAKEEEMNQKRTRVDELDARRQDASAKQRECVNQRGAVHQAHDADSAKLHRTELSHDRAENELKVMTDHIFNTYDLTYAGAEELRCQGPFDLSGSEAASLIQKMTKHFHLIPRQQEPMALAA